jgi:hypothetical protein
MAAWPCGGIWSMVEIRRWMSTRRPAPAAASCPDLYANLRIGLGFLYVGVVRFGAVEGFDMDLLMIFGTIVFFVVAIAYTAACDRLK